jgi:hypothetical protein
VSNWEYATPTVPVGRDVGVIPVRDAAGVTLPEAVEVGETPIAFVAVTVNV